MITMSSEAPLSKVIVALDCNNENDALEIANLLDPKLCNLKIGLELFISCGPSIVKKIHNLNYKIFLDLKLHDISNTVLKSINTIGKLGIWMTNIHSSGGKKMMLNAQEELRKVQKDCLLLGVTILTSLNDKDLKEIGFQNNVNNQVLQMASLCHQSKLNGIVCSAYEAKVIKENFPSIGLHKILEIACFGLSDMFNKDGTSRYFNPKLSGWALLSREAVDNYESIFNPETTVLGARWRN